MINQIQNSKFETNSQHNEKGQILLITVMLLATAITVVMAISFSSTTETQITKLEESSQKALAAAEAALEAAIQKRASVAIDSLPTFDDTGITGQANIVEVGGQEFATPLLQKDEQYLFYLTSYNQPTFGTDYWRGWLTVYAQSESGQCPVLELTVVAADNTLTRYIMDPACANLISSGTPEVATSLTSPSDTPGDTVDKMKFTYRTTQGIDLSSTNNKLLIIRVLNASTRIGFKGSSTGGGIYNWINLKSQGRLVISEAKTQDGITKRIELFQSYPQIPSDFFVTSF